MKKQINTDKHGLGLEGLVGLFEQTQSVMQMQAARSADIALVVRNWLFGWYIVEFENGGADRSELYGKRLIEILSKRLIKLGIKGMSPTNLRKFRKFYQAYRKIQQALPVESSSRDKSEEKIQQAMPDKCFQLINKSDILQEVTATLTNRLNLGWTHYVTLLTVKNEDERRFYELEARGIPGTPHLIINIRLRYLLNYIKLKNRGAGLEKSAFQTLTDFWRVQGFTQCINGKTTPPTK
ncbi:MAG: DUF1016 N-terminal domain-containing protein [Thermodesulfobacteriota bacterium]|nr:DUF1016 N-terminal domain-containing protein [Thermodesulfobacteriota bacterium]